MSDYIVDIIGNEPYYVEISGSTSSNTYNIEVTRTNDSSINIVSDYSNFIIALDELPSGYPAAYVSGLIETIQANIAQQSLPNLQDLPGTLQADQISGYGEFAQEIIIEPGKDPETKTYYTIDNLAIDGGTP